MPLRQRGGQHALDCGEGGGIAVATRTMTTMTRKGVIPNGGGGSDDGDRALSLTQKAEDRRVEPRVTPREFGRLRRGRGLLAASRRRREDPAKTRATSKCWL